MVFLGNSDMLADLTGEVKRVCFYCILTKNIDIFVAPAPVKSRQLEGLSLDEKNF